MTKSGRRNYSLKRRIQALAIVAILIASFALTIGASVIEHYLFHDDVLEARLGAELALRNLVLADPSSEEIKDFRADLDEIADANPDFWYYAEANGRTIQSKPGLPRYKNLMRGSTPAIAIPEQPVECPFFADYYFAEELTPPLRVVQSKNCGDQSYYLEVDGIISGVGFNHDITRILDANSSIGYLTRKNILPSVLLAVLLVGMVTFMFSPVTTRIRNVSRVASQIGVGEHHLVLPENDLPKEIVPMVKAVNRAINRLEAANEQQELFIATAAHELRTPLAIHRAQIEELPDSKLKNKLIKNTQRMASMITQLLALAKLGTAERSFENINLAEAVEETCLERGSAAFNAGKKLSLDIVDSTATVSGDRVAIQTAVANLIDNALAFTEVDHQVSVSVDGHQVTVSDTGPGIPEDRLEQIFEPFYKHPPNKRGHGLGLAIVAEIMRLHGGAVEGRNESDGATFELTFKHPKQA